MATRRHALARKSSTERRRRARAILDVMWRALPEDERCRGQVPIAEWVPVAPPDDELRHRAWNVGLTHGWDEASAAESHRSHFIADRVLELAATARRELGIEGCATGA